MTSFHGLKDMAKEGHAPREGDKFQGPRQCQRRAFCHPVQCGRAGEDRTSPSAFTWSSPSQLMDYVADLEGAENSSYSAPMIERKAARSLFGAVRLPRVGWLLGRIAADRLSGTDVRRCK